MDLTHPKMSSGSLNGMFTAAANCLHEQLTLMLVCCGTLLEFYRLKSQNTLSTPWSLVAHGVQTGDRRQKLSWSDRVQVASHKDTERKQDVVASQLEAYLSLSAKSPSRPAASPTKKLSS